MIASGSRPSPFPRLVVTVTDPETTLPAIRGASGI